VAPPVTGGIQRMRTPQRLKETITIKVLTAAARANYISTVKISGNLPYLNLPYGVTMTQSSALSSSNL
jgi:hypothetical protein